MIQPEDLFRIIAETASDAIITIDDTSTILFINPAAERIFGYRLSEMIGQSLTMLMPEYLRHVHEAALERYTHTGKRHIDWEGVELPGLHKSGAALVLEVSFGEVVKDGKPFFTGIIREVSGRKRLEARRAAQYALTKVIAEATTFTEAAPRLLQTVGESTGWTGGAVWLVNGDGDTLGFKASWLSQATLASFEGLEAFEKASRDTAFAPGVGLPGRVWQSGKPVWIRDVAEDSKFSRAAVAAEANLHAVCAFPICNQGRTVGVLEFFDFVTREPDEDLLQMMEAFGNQIGDFFERTRVEEALRDAHRELEHRVAERTAQLEATNQELEAFSYSVSHDLRAPLRGIDGFSNALLQDYGESLEETAKGYLHRVRAGAQRMGGLIDDLLKLSRFSRVEIHLKEVNLSELAQEIADELQERDPQRQVAFSIAPGLVVEGDKGLLRVVLENLLNNAWKFTQKQLHAAIELGMMQEEDQLVYFVKDNGAGFDMHYANKLFTAFQRLHSPAEYEGTGIGLATVQRIIHRHGGRLWAGGEVDKGATFYFTLPSSTALGDTA